MFSKFLLIAAVMAVFNLKVFSFELKMNTLYITNGDVNSVVSTMLESYGMNFEVVKLPLTSIKLENGNVGLYDAIVIENASNAMLSGISKQISEYQKKYRIRVAYLNCEPDQSLGFSNSNQNVRTVATLLTDKGLELAKEYQMNGKNVQLEVGTCVYNVANAKCDPYSHYEVQAKGDGITPLLKYNDTDAYAGAIVKQKDIESIHFFIPYIDSIVAYFTSHLWIYWTNHGIIDGFRRLYFNIQVDDFFIKNLFNYVEGTGFRTSVDDMKGIANWQKDIVGRMPKGSEFKTELALNGIHILIEANHKQFIASNWTTTPVERSYVKPLNVVGTNRWQPADLIDTEWDIEALMADKLYEYFAQNPEAQDDFHWLSHTFSHQNLDLASLNDAYMETGLNIKMSDDPYLGMYKRPCFSPHSIICPEISGLHNGHVLQMFEENGIKYAVGDTSRTDLNPENFYLPMVTNITTSNYDGFLVIPRQPPQIYWDCSTVDQNLEIYKTRYNKEIDWTTHLNNEANLHVKNFLKLRHDPYMFHEGNLRNVGVPEVTIEGVTGNFGLLQQWVERIVAEIKKYMDWPLISKKMDDLADTYIQRLDQSKCKPQYTMVIDDKTFNINEIKVAATTGACRVPLFVVGGTEFQNGSVSEIEQYGNDPATAWIDLNGNAPKSVKFTKDIKWSDNASTVAAGNASNDESGCEHLINYSWKFLIISLATLIFF
ncbi:hypothetical protein H8356DRAFT_1635662 [Neocallimastix lanati (nom. inval.)]|jgi:hypothetical protein|uniref:Thioredoxin domain-containing protein n=1 Tax=Neocallimastix californiae TaxID=1754190 RepID=A0A1Y2AHE9_9FUNG|nr:hypothetical protein H8356DRAFT_1635662 [Neocallimastix sp. JGI-2020a]ORY21999.1 hypothetical protein LY90DRAFT_707264 [Neocallimastix californiae]|eukprot:ORY21999.1 hypothetical protein LY90DRAFT_707264 [Neocallimastix californiae]